jgi:hypothetical protein
MRAGIRIACYPWCVAIAIPPHVQAALAREHLARLTKCVPWNPAIKWTHQLNIQGATYDVLELWPGIAPSDDPVETLRAGQFVDSPTRKFRYCVRLHRRGQALLTWWGSQVGTVVFDSDVIIPALYEARPEDQRSDGHFEDMPWMSLTPAELMTLRPGTRKAKGHTVIAGLGLGHQLIEVTKRLQVKRVTIVELDAELVEWIMPRIRPHLRKPVEVVVGDAYEVIPRLKADVALIDIFPGYGDGFRRVGELAARSPGIKTFWGWGTSEMRGLGQADR